MTLTKTEDWGVLMSARYSVIDVMTKGRAER
jgi:hypothetical protein